MPHGTMKQRCCSDYWVMGRVVKLSWSMRTFQIKPPITMYSSHVSVFQVVLNFKRKVRVISISIFQVICSDFGYPVICKIPFSLNSLGCQTLFLTHSIVNSVAPILAQCVKPLPAFWCSFRQVSSPTSIGYATWPAIAVVTTIQKALWCVPDPEGTTCSW